MKDRTLAKLEFHKILAKLGSFCVSSLGKELAEELTPSKDYREVTLRLEETEEGVQLLRLHPEVPMAGLKDVRAALKRVGIGSDMDASELLDLSETLKVGRRLNKFFTDVKENYPLLREIAGQMGDFRRLEDKINFAVLPTGEISDHATPELYDIRRKLKVFQNRIKERLDAILKNPNYQKMLQEQIVTVRGDRYVLPVRQEYRGSFPGIIHDQSASGATLFIEPQGVVEASNELRRVVLEEKAEIAKILRQLTALVAAELDEISATIIALGRMDFVLAKAKYAYELDGVKPKFNPEGRINIIKGRHPLIKGKVVPTSIQLGQEFSVLVITGPNTGGKTVTLKTVGLFVSMAQAGLHVPAEVGSELGLFTQVFCDIGDEQSIEQSLSTFSSHMTNIIDILNTFDSQSLIILDEIGAGTDPTEGAALGMAILEQMRRRGSKVIATTHYSQLKNYAYSTDGVENASVEFDVATLRPTYRLLIGQPGRSNAFEISMRLGLDEQIVERAKEFMSKEEVQVATLIESLEESQRAAEAERDEAERLREEIEGLRYEYQRMQKQVEARREKILAQAQTEALEVVKAARQEAEQILAELKEKLAEEEGRGKLHAAQAARASLRSSQYDRAEALAKGEAQAPGEIPRSVQPGQEYYVPRFKQNAHVLKVDEEKIQIQVGIMKLTVEPSELRVIKETTKKALEKTGAGAIMAAKAQHISNEIDLRGLMVEECIEAAEKYLDDAVLAGVQQVYLIHGKGTGALRKAIETMLRYHPHVEDWRLGNYSEGGTGVTVVTFKKN